MENGVRYMQFLRKWVDKELFFEYDTAKVPLSYVLKAYIFDYAVSAISGHCSRVRYNIRRAGGVV